MKRITVIRLPWYGSQLALMLALAFALSYEAPRALDVALVIAIALWTLLAGLGEWQVGPLGAMFRRAAVDDAQDRDPGEGSTRE